MTEKVDITGLEKREVVKALWDNAKPARHYDDTRTQAPTVCSDTELDVGLKTGYFDYLSGRVIKTSFKTDQLDPWAYDRDNGPGAMKRVVDELRAKR